MADATRIWTIGYEGVTQAELIASLKSAGIELLIDVRAVPLSRRPGFSKNILANGLKEAGIGYIHLRDLGTPPEGREAARKGKHDLMHTVYAQQLELPEAELQALQMRDLAKEKRSALLCFERAPEHCHRSFLLQAKAPDFEVVDLDPSRPGN